MPQAAAGQQDSKTTTGPDPAAAGAFAQFLIDQAKQLERERAVLQDKIGENRNQLRGLDKLGVLSDEQGEWLDKFYPEKERGERRSKEDIEATRKIRLEARKAA